MAIGSTRDDAATWWATSDPEYLPGLPGLNIDITTVAGHVCAGDDDARRFLAAVFFGFFNHLINGVFDGLGKFFYCSLYPERSFDQINRLMNCFNGRSMVSR